MLPDRLAGVTCVVLAAGIAIGAYQFYVPYQYEPLGPAVFPYLVAATLCVAGGFLIITPDVTNAGLGLRHLGVLAIVLGYAYLLEPLGYPVATALGAGSLGLIFGLSVRRALLMGLLLSLAVYAVLVGGLGLNLPIGWLWAELVAAR
jgi:putative tricarboxylic transport membrane protein